MPPRRQRGEGSVCWVESRQHWRGEIDLGWHAGKRRRKVVYAPTQAACIKKLNAAKRDRDAGVLTSGSTTVTAWLDYWMSDILPARLKPKTAQTYRTYVEQYLKPVLGKKKLRQLETRHIRELHRHMRALTTRRDKPMSETTVHHAHRILSTALNDAMKEGLLTRNVTTLVDAPGVAPSKRGALTATQARKVLTVAARDERMASRWLAAFLLGARQGECLGLRWSHVDLDTGVVDVAWTLQRIDYRHGCNPPCGRTRGDRCPQRRLNAPPGMPHLILDGNLCLVPPKTTGSTRVLPLAPPLLAALRLWHDLSAAEPNPHDLVWHRADGRPIDGRDDYLAWVTLLQQAGVPHVTLHEARHTTASLLMAAGVDPRIVKEILGHSSVVTTQGYQHVDLELSRKALSGVGEQLTDLT